MKKCLLLFFLFWLFFIISFSPSFSQSISSLTYNDGFKADLNHWVYAMASQNGKILIGGYFTEVNGIKKNYIARLNYDGSIDNSFDCSINGYVSAITVQNDGKILIAGDFTNVNGISRNKIARLNHDGSLDNSFNVEVNGFISSIVIYSDNAIIIGGQFTIVNGVYKLRIAMLDSKGNLNNNFNASINGSVENIAVQQDRKILIGGYFTSVNNDTSRKHIVRLNPDGSLDSTFNCSLNNYVFSIAIQRDGKIIIGGDFTTVNDISRDRVARVNYDGSLDNSFNISSNSDVRSVAIQSDGKIVIGGYFTTLNSTTKNYIGRINFDGSLDNSFNPDFNNSIKILLLTEDDKIIAGGNFSTVETEPRNKLARLHKDGRLDKTLTSSTDGTVHAIAIQQDEKILIGGIFSKINNTTRTGIGRLHVDGSLDSNFDVTLDTNTVYSIVIQSDGKIIIAGSFNTVNGTARNNIARLNSDGSLDNTFNISVNGPIYALALQNDGKILIGGNFGLVNGQVRTKIARVDQNGTLDNLSTNLNDDVYTIALQSDGKILIGGKFTNSGLLTRNYIARLNSDGSIDLTFNPNANSFVYSIAVLPNDDFIIGGLFTTIAGMERKRIAKLDKNGNVIDNFAASADSVVKVILIQQDGKVLIGGYFNNVNNYQQKYIARLNSNGILDTSLNSYTNDYVFAIAIQKDNKILLGGSFTQAGGLSRERLARLSSNYAYDNLDVSLNGLKIKWHIYGMQIINDVLFQYSADQTNWLFLGNGTQDLDGGWSLSPLNLPYQQVFYIKALGKVISGSNNSSNGYIGAIKQFYNFYRIDVSKEGSGSGTVIDSDGNIVCGDDCSEIYSGTSNVNLIAIPDSDSEFIGWSGSCNGTERNLSIQISSYKNCIATFQKVIYLNDGATVTNSSSIRLNIYPSATSTRMTIFNGKVWSPEENFVNIKNISVPGGDGKKEVYVRLLIDGEWREYKDSIYMDVKAPIGGIQINQGAQYTSSTSVTLNLSVADMQDYDKLFMSFSNDKINWSGWESFSETKIYTLTDGEGLKTVYVQYKDSGGKLSAIYSDTIMLKSILGIISDPSIIDINSGAQYTNKTGIILIISPPIPVPPTSPYTKMALSQDGVKWSSWSTITSPKSISLTGTDGIKRVYIKFKNDDGEESNIYYDEIILDRKKPVGVLLINNGDYITNQSMVYLTFNVMDELSGVYFVSFSKDGTNFDASYDYPAVLPINYLLSGDGVKKVYMKIVDKAGNVSSKMIDTIILDSIAPSGKVVINGGAQSTTNRDVTLTLSAPGAVWMKISVDGTIDTEAWESYKTKKLVTLPDGVGIKEVKVIFKDLAGNVSTEYVDTIELK